MEPSTWTRMFAEFVWQLEALRNQLAELQERADFSERLLTDIRQAQLGAPARSDLALPVAPSVARRPVTPVS